MQSHLEEPILNPIKTHLGNYVVQPEFNGASISVLQCGCTIKKNQLRQSYNVHNNTTNGPRSTGKYLATTPRVERRKLLKNAQSTTVKKIAVSVNDLICLP